jgi:glycosyltransferase involved in cell wall biosynthesis
MRVISIGLDGQVGAPDRDSHAVTWVREMARHVDGYVELGPSPDGRDAGPIALAGNASAWLVGGSPLLYPWRAARLGTRLHAQQAFDVITTEDPIRAGLAGVLLAKKTGLPLNVENHSFHVNEPVWLRERLHHRIYNRIAIAVCRRADTIRNYSAGQERALLDIGVPESRMHTVPIAAPCIAPVEEAEARRMAGMGEEPFVLCAGRMVAYKNIETLLLAFGNIAASSPARLLLIGNGPAKKAWQDLASSLALGDRVIWRDAVPFSAMAGFYSAATLFAAPAVHETGPRTVLEALLCGCPVAVTPEMGVVHSGICVEGESAVVIPPRDVEGWTRALQSMLSDPARGRRMADAGRRRIGPEFSLSSIALQLVRMFEGMATNRTAVLGSVS